LSKQLGRTLLLPAHGFCYTRFDLIFDLSKTPNTQVLESKPLNVYTTGGNFWEGRPTYDVQHDRCIEVPKMYCMVGHTCERNIPSILGCTSCSYRAAEMVPLRPDSEHSVVMQLESEKSRLITLATQTAFYLKDMLSKQSKRDDHALCAGWALGTCGESFAHLSDQCYFEWRDQFSVLPAFSEKVSTASKHIIEAIRKMAPPDKQTVCGVHHRYYEGKELRGSIHVN